MFLIAEVRRELEEPSLSIVKMLLLLKYFKIYYAISFFLYKNVKIFLC